MAGLWQAKMPAAWGLFGAARFLASQSAFDTLVGDRDAEFGAHALGDCPIAHALRPKRLHFGEGSLLVLFLDENAILTDPPAEWPITAEILPGSPCWRSLAAPAGRSARSLGGSSLWQTYCPPKSATRQHRCRRMLSSSPGLVQRQASPTCKPQSSRVLSSDQACFSSLSQDPNLGKLSSVSLGTVRSDQFVLISAIGRGLALRLRCIERRRRLTSR